MPGRNRCIEVAPGPNNVTDEIEVPAMREINQSDVKLGEALRRVAAAADHDAPAALGDGLMHRFRRHHARRRRIRLGAMAVVGVTVLVAAILSSRPAAVRAPQVSQQNLAGNKSALPIRSVQPQTASSSGKRAQARRKRRRRIG